MYEYDSKFAYIGIPEAQKFFRMGESITGLELKFKDVDAARAEGRRVVAALGGFPYRAKDWAELNRNLFSALKLEKLAMAIILTFIVLVACFNILSTLIMLVLEKTKEISILKSMGARDSSVMKIFVLAGREGDPRLAGRLLRARARRDGLARRSERGREEHLPPRGRYARPAHRGSGPLRRAGRVRDGGGTARAVPQPEHRLRLPVPLPAAGVHRAGEHGHARAHRPDAASRSGAGGPADAGDGRPLPPRGAQAGRAFRRRAAAGGAGEGAGPEAAPVACRRADRESRRGDRRGHPPASRRPEPAPRHRRHRGDAQSAARGADAAPIEVARRAGHRGVGSPPSRAADLFCGLPPCSRVIWFEVKRSASIGGAAGAPKR